jgi:hypothetical protein
LVKTLRLWHRRKGPIPTVSDRPGFLKADLGAGAAKWRFVRSLPVQKSCSERRFILDLPFMDHAAEVPEESRLTDAASFSNVFSG